jgi:hypothetical protein
MDPMWGRNAFNSYSIVCLGQMNWKKVVAWVCNWGHIRNLSGSCAIAWRTVCLSSAAISAVWLDSIFSSHAGIVSPLHGLFDYSIEYDHFTFIMKSRVIQTRCFRAMVLLFRLHRFDHYAGQPFCSLTDIPPIDYTSVQIAWSIKIVFLIPSFDCWHLTYLRFILMTKARSIFNETLSCNLV